MPSTRREFIQYSLATGALAGTALLPGGLPFALADDQPTRKLKLLILGGTGFLGPHTVRAALERGHEMTLFNRGKTNPHLFPDLEKLRGDRYEDISALEGRQWDAVIDTFTYVPRVVKASADLLADQVRQYVVISTISVYKSYDTPGMDENAPLAEVPADVVEKIQHHREVAQWYGGMKALCEQAAEKSIPGRVCNIRPGLIVGPGDPSDRFTYWPVRVARGGEVLCPNSPKDKIQHIDVRDLAAFIITAIEQRLTGAFNADSPAGARTMGMVVDESRSVSGSDATFTWVPTSFLTGHGVSAWQDMPQWVPAEGEYRGFGQVSTKKAQQAGLSCRPLRETVAATLDWWQEQPEERRANLRAGIKPEREREVLAAWHEQEGGGKAGDRKAGE